MKTDSALTVSQLNMYVKMMFESDIRLNKVLIVGEISNFTNHYKTGHCYFSLKDSNCAIKAVMFSSSAKKLKFMPENGMRVYAAGRVSVFERDGVYQLYVDSLEPEGTGALLLAFEQLKAKLESEGLFDDEIKKPLPEYPEKIAVITSPVGAAVQDVINVISRRYPLAEIILCPVAAQGVNCSKENIKAIEFINKNKCADLIILCRGGGSIEDLWGYNDEFFVRSVSKSSIPIITGIGHETDFTLCDFAADMRAPTPSAAAELSVPDINELYQITDSLLFRADRVINQYFDKLNSEYGNISVRLSAHNPKKVLTNRFSELELIKNQLLTITKSNIDKKSVELVVLSEKLKLLNPFEILKKGFVPVYHNDKKVFSVSDLDKNMKISLDFFDGRAICNVDEIIKSEK